MKAINHFAQLLPVCWRSFLFGLLVTLFYIVPTFTSAQTVEWVQQLGTERHDNSHGVSADGLGNVYIAGGTYGSLGDTNAGDCDAFLCKYNSSGTLLWSKQLGTSDYNTINSVSTDVLGNVYIVSDNQKVYTGGSYMSLSKYDASGTLLWTEHLGTNTLDHGYDVSTDGLGNVYITGGTNGNLGSTNAGNCDAFLSKYDALGTLLWTEQLGTNKYDVSFSVSADSLGNAYISGETRGSLGGTNAGGSDAFLSKYDASGTLLWTEQLGTNGDDGGGDVSTDGLGNVYISGNTNGSLEGLNAGNYDAFVSKYDVSGKLIWTKQLGTSDADFGTGVSTDRLGNVYITGNTDGSLGNTNAGDRDVFVRKYDASGTLLWTQQLGTCDIDRSSGVSTDGLGNIYFSGYTKGNLGGINAGGNDAFVGKITDVPEPSTLLLAILGLITLAIIRYH